VGATTEGNQTKGGYNMLKVVTFVLGGSVVITLVSMAISPILHILGKGEMDGLFTGVLMVGMLALMLVGIFAVLNGVWDMTGMGSPLGSEYYDNFFQPGGLDKFFGRVK